MKKLVLSIVVFLMTIVLIPVVKADKTNEEKVELVNVYMLSKEGCSACAAAKEYFTDLANNNPDLFKLYDIQIFDGNWQFESDELQQLFLKVYDEIGEDSSKAATPTILIGDYHTIGLPQDTSVVYDAIVAAKGKEDKMQKIAKELNIDLEKVSNKDVQEEDNKSGKYDTLIIIGIFIVLIGGFAGLVVASKK